MCDLTQKRDDSELKLKKYEILYTAYADEIRNLWQRSIFLGAFMTLAWGGYGALQLKFIEQCLQNICAYHFASLGLCFVIIVLSLLWIAMAKGSKFVQEAHEKHIRKFNFNETEQDIKKLFCELDEYEYIEKNGNSDTKKEMDKDLSPNLFFSKALKAYRYSPSKINIALGWFSAVMACVLTLLHICKIGFTCPYFIVVVLIFVVGLFVLSWFIKKQVKGGAKDKKLSFLKMFLI
ncbi:RipA family octameric membrane protein [Helicobacter sp. 23-1044]